MQPDAAPDTVDLRQVRDLILSLRVETTMALARCNDILDKLAEPLPQSAEPRP